jgi:hypothetical protein
LDVSVAHPGASDAIADNGTEGKRCGWEPPAIIPPVSVTAFTRSAVAIVIGLISTLLESALLDINHIG